MSEVHWSTKEDTPSHLWPEKVRCPHEGCGAPVAKVGVRAPAGRVIWVCENGHDDVATAFLQAMREQE